MAHKALLTNKQVVHVVHERLREALQELIIKHYNGGTAKRSVWSCSELEKACRSVNVNLDARKLLPDIQKELLEEGWVLGDPSPDWGECSTLTCQYVGAAAEELFVKAARSLDNTGGVVVLKRDADGGMSMYNVGGKKARTNQDE